eukprot:2634099-Rhodomonas_salina.2
MEGSSPSDVARPRAWAEARTQRCRAKGRRWRCRGRASSCPARGWAVAPGSTCQTARAFSRTA